LRAPPGQNLGQVEELAKKVLQSYGVAVVDLEGLVRIVPDSSLAGYLPEIQRGSALPDSPSALRPQFYLIELTAVRQTEVMSWLRTMFQDRIRVLEDPTRNALLVSGPPDALQSAMDAIRVLDQPTMAGHKGLRIVTDLWIADELAKRLFEVLTAEGYGVQPIGQIGTGGVRYPIMLLPVASINSIFVFANSQDVLDHIRAWVDVLDKPNEKGVGRSYFMYTARNTDATELANTLSQLMGRGAGAGTTSSGKSSSLGVVGGTTTSVMTQSQQAGANATGVVVDKGSNALIFQGNAEDYPQIRGLLATLDRPPKEALIEVTVAEVDLTGSWQYGIDWNFSGGSKGGNSYTVSNTTGGAVAAGASGFSYQLFGSSGQIRAAFSAIASDNRTTILSSPRIMAKNGQTATIQVGQQVPIVTSQQTSLTASTGNQTGVLQAIEYKDTGVILKVKPVIHSDDQIELEVEQEVSAAGSTSTGVNNSPTFSTRKVQTSLTLKNGSTVLLGGIISSNKGQGDSGIPFLKDIPVLGNFFSSVNVSNDRTELIVLITPYIVNDDFDAQAITNAFRNQLGPWAAPSGPEGALPVKSSQLTPVQKSEQSTQGQEPAAAHNLPPVPAASGAAAQP